MKNPEQVMMETIEELDRKYAGRIMVTDMMMESIRQEFFALLLKKTAAGEFDPSMHWEQPGVGMVKLLPGWKERTHIVVDGDLIILQCKAILPLHKGILPIKADEPKEQAYRIEVRAEYYGTLADAEAFAGDIAAYAHGEVTAIWDENWEEC